MMNPFSAAALACFTFFLCEGLSCCAGSRAMVNGVLDSVPAINGTTVNNGAAAVPSSGRPGIASQLHKRVGRAVVQKSMRKSRVKGITASSRSTKTIAATVGVLLASILGLLLASAKLLQCPTTFQANTRGDAEGNTRRRLAEGGNSSTKCVS
ncbi:UNVERIFIED_CONTAM: Toxoplasma gondii family B protein [Hammondia hammondi]|eukprot:XP_008887729.1 Toxoplasma gondii family B protein [Hammondia hammondi]